MKQGIENLTAPLRHPATALIIVSVGLVLRLGALAWLSPTPLFADARSYHRMALQLAHGEQFSPYWPPGLPYYLSFFARVFSESEIISRSGTLLLYVVFSILLYKLAKRLTDMAAANLALLIFSLYPSYIHLSVESLTELPAATCLLATTYFAYLGGHRRSWLALCVTGLALGWLSLIRPSAIMLIPLVAAYVVVRTKRVLLSALPCVVALVIISCWLYKAHHMAGHFVMINQANTRNVFFGNNPHTPLYRTWWFGSHGPGEPGVPDAYTALHARIKQLPEDAQNQAYRNATLDYVLAQPDLFLLRTVNRIRNYFAFDTYSGSVLIKGYRCNKVTGLLVLGLDAIFFTAILSLSILFLFTRTPSVMEKDGVTLILATVCAYAMPYWFSFSYPRFHIPIMPLLGIFGAAMLKQLIEQPRASLFGPLAHSAWRRYGLVLAFVLLAYIQIEWIFVMYWRPAS